MASTIRIAHTAMDSRLGDASLMPSVSVRLDHAGKACDAIGLVDSGASVNVLPFHLGCDLGLDWEQQANPIQLSGNLADCDARAVLLAVDVANLPAVNLVFAWTRRDDVPLIFGQTNFFMKFDVSFFRSLGFFTVSAHDGG